MSYHRWAAWTAGSRRCRSYCAIFYYIISIKSHSITLYYIILYHMISYYSIL